MGQGTEAPCPTFARAHGHVQHVITAASAIALVFYSAHRYSQRYAPARSSSVSLHDLIEFPAEQPGQTEERDQHHDAKARRGIVDGGLRELTEGIAGRDNRSGPKACRNEIERKEGRPGQPRYPVSKSREPADAVRETMKQDHPEIATVRQANDGLYGALEPRKTIEQAGAITPSDPEADDVAGEKPPNSKKHITMSVPRSSAPECAA